MKINAKKTNSASENAIQSSYFVLALRKHSHTQTLRSGKHFFLFQVNSVICMSPDGNRNITSKKSIHSAGAKAFGTSIVVARTS